MRQFITIASNAFMELVRQPIFLLLMTASCAFEVFLACVNYFGFGDEPKLVKNSVLAVMFLTGLFAAVLSASASVAREIRTGTALAVLAKPVGRAQFLLAKFFGLALALAMLVYTNTIAALFASRMAFDAYGGVDFPALGIFSGALVLGYLVAGFTNFFLRRPFMADAVFSVVVMLTLAFVAIHFIKKNVSPNETYTGMDWRLIPASVLILFALWILAAIALACSTRLEVIPTLAICSALFMLGLMSDYLFGRRAETGSWWATTIYTITPNWQLFWLADVLESGKKFPLAYVGKAAGYMVGYVGAALALGLLLFEDRELT
ncbi:MAG: ABC transporter permease [Verrucomicrobiota bacterium]